MMKLRINPIVAEDLKNIKEYIAEDNEDMAVKTIQEIYARIENIQQFPYMGTDLAKRVSFRADYKYVICGNYVVLYKIREDCVEIYRVVNQYQDITKIFSK
ncbi:MAG: type II toxin-antitoxin system RelE/ParE family toxin [Lachnospiraceae bacterium]|nr:type II toxin-antitoxin system RelE/ParE family toxin [Lachnospiraceae bacterium]